MVGKEGIAGHQETLVHLPSVSLTSHAALGSSRPSAGLGVPAAERKAYTGWYLQVSSSSSKISLAQ